MGMGDYAKRDLRHLNMEMAKERTQKSMLHKLKYINKNKTKNKFLKEVAEEYNEYYKNIIREKGNIIETMEKLLLYLDNLMDDLSGPVLKRVEFQIKNIMKELTRVKINLDEIK